MKFHAAFLFLLVPCWLQAGSYSEWAHSKAWKAMLYVDQNYWGRFRSNSDSEKFFITSSGAHQIESELEASIQAVQSEVSALMDTSFSCRFPARAKWIRKQILNLPPVDESGCVKLNQWRERISAQSVTLVFSSFYLGNPSSSFGHTLLRMNNSGKNQSIQRELLSYGINYGATPWTQNPLLYTFNGLFGFFPGNFVAIPYYYKVREYNDYESRDLWEYELDLTAEEIERLVDLLWEQGENHYDYYFLTENCGYYMVAVLEAAAPRYEILSGLRKWVIPSDTIVQFKKSGIIKSKKLRPSIYHQFLSRAVLLNSTQEEILQDLVDMELAQSLNWPNSFEKLPDPDKSLVLDAVLDYIDFIHSKDLIKFDAPKNPVKEAWLIRRSQLPTASLRPAKADIEKMAPENAHGSFRWQLKGEYRQSSYAQKSEVRSVIAGRFAFHDLEDPTYGAPAGAQIEVMNLKLSIPISSDQSSEVQLDDMKIAEIGSYTAWTRWAPKNSYNVSFGIRNEDSRFLCSDFCRTGYVNMAYGRSYQLDNWTLSGLAHIKTVYGDFQTNADSRWWYASVGPRLIVQYDLNSENQWRLEGLYEAASTEKNKLYRTELIYRHNFKNDFSLEWGVQVDDTYEKTSLSVYYFTF